MSTAKRQREEPCYICGHFHNYEGGERCGVCGHVMPPSSVTVEDTGAMPTQILPGFLYLGSYDHASRLELLKAMGITHVLSLVPSCQELYRNTLVYHTVGSNPADFSECFDFIDRVRSEQKRLVVHCMTGIAKSPAIVVGYLMKLRGWTLAESFVWVRDRHNATSLSQGDSERLQLLELKLLGSSSTGYRQSQTGTSEPGRQPFGALWQTPSWKPPPPAPAISQPQSSTPSLSFARAPDGARKGFVFGLDRGGSLVQQTDSGQSAMDV